ncbi:6-bladed beta-propeller [candidate division KSB1 bacterium]
MRYLLNLILVFLLFHCGGHEESYTVEEIDGVRYVHNVTPLWEEDSKLSIEFEFKLGVLEGEDDDYIFSRPVDAVCDKDGNIYVLDSGNSEVKKYNAAGIYVLTIGNRGNGPGEFTAPQKLGIINDTNLYVYEASRRMQILTFDGEYVDSKTLMMAMGGARSNNNGTFVGNIMSFYAMGADIKGEEDGKDNNLALFNQDGELVSSFSNLHNFGEEHATRFGNYLGFDFDKDSYIYVTYRSLNRIEKFSPDGSLLMYITRELPFKEDYETVIEQIPAMGGRDARELKTADYTIFSSKGLGVDSKNRIWVPTYLRQADKDRLEEEVRYSKDLMCYEVYNSESLLLSRIPVDVYYKYFRVSGDRLFCIDDRYEVCVNVYMIVEK